MFFVGDVSKEKMGLISWGLHDQNLAGLRLDLGELSPRRKPHVSFVFSQRRDKTTQAPPSKPFIATLHLHRAGGFLASIEPVLNSQQSPAGCQLAAKPNQIGG